jgi:hypothetical protein
MAIESAVARGLVFALSVGLLYSARHLARSFMQESVRPWRTVLVSLLVVVGIGACVYGSRSIREAVDPGDPMFGGVEVVVTGERSAQSAANAACLVVLLLGAVVGDGLVAGRRARPAARSGLVSL